MALPGFLIRHISSFIYPKPFLHMIILCSCTRICLNQLRNLPNIHCMQQLCKYGLDLIWENEKSKIVTVQSSCLGIHFNEYLRLGVWRVKIILDAYISLSDVNEISEKFPIHISRYSFFDHCFLPTLSRPRLNVNKVRVFINWVCFVTYMGTELSSCPKTCKVCRSSVICDGYRVFEDDSIRNKTKLKESKDYDNNCQTNLIKTRKILMNI